MYGKSGKISDSLYGLPFTASERRLLFSLTPTTDDVLPYIFEELATCPKDVSDMYVTPLPLFTAVQSVNSLFETFDVPNVVNPELLESNLQFTKLIFAPASTSTGPSKVLPLTVSFPL